MPSPFPGMNPYLERATVWHDFHERFLILGAGIVGAQVRPNFIVKVDEHLYVREVPEEPRRFAGRADLGIMSTPARGARAEGVALIEPPARIRMTAVDVAREAFLEIRDRASMEVVTVIELLSPSNKRNGPDRDQYLAKRGQILASPAHLVEIDLLRVGAPMPGEDRPACCYSITVGRAEERLDAGFWPIGLRDPLPVIPIPLKAPHPDATLDLQALLHRVYDEAGYEFYAYDGPPEPALSPEDDAWARQFVPAAR
ncbi:DUF4058 family protein [Tautonia plasticadhaerens]|uniref:DUF4058 domain-containing protein n=1 Tax=Tautonia plasticadhaerens TaxID=2527974 RepID=A0A518HBE7_9BACT|nr:DUF4058 family protein [Tautonia plasticadhaerens]QDV38151.1 hypothetical protein ElP_61000 [Tautonia plasticadhaerens]